MSTVTGQSKFTPEDVLRLEGEERFELVDGQLVSTELSALAAIVCSRICALLSATVNAGKLGAVMTSEASYRCFAEERDRVRRPDVSFIHRSRMRPEYLEGHIPVPPDLAVEVVSPNDLFREVRRKVPEYIRAGVRLVWCVDPEVRTVDIYRADSTSAVVSNGDALDGEDVVPGLHCPVAELLELPPMDV